MAEKIRRQQMAVNSVIHKLSRYLVGIFLLLTIFDLAGVLLCGWIWTSLATLFCLAGYFVGRDHASYARLMIGALFVIVGFSAGITPFVYLWLVR